jgi:hypothetical protein
MLHVVKDRSTPILLQKSKVAPVRIFGETLKHEAIDDSDNLTKNAPAALRIFDTFSKTTFATLSAKTGPSSNVAFDRLGIHA